MFWTCPLLALQIPANMWGGVKIEQLPKSKSPLSAILMFFWHKWEDGSRKVDTNTVNFSSSPWNFGPVMNQDVRKPCFSTSIPRGQNPSFPHAAACAGPTLKSRSRPLPTHPGMKYFRKGNPRCWHSLWLDTCNLPSIVLGLRLASTWLRDVW